MKRLFISRYIFLLLAMIFITMCFHYIFIRPLFEHLFQGYFQMLLAFVIEPIICILIVVMIINKKEKQIYQ